MKHARIVGVAVAFLASGSLFAQDLKTEAQTRLQSLVAATKTMTWTHTTYEIKGKKTEETTGNCFWQGIDLQRIDVTDGRGKGRTVVLRGTELDTGWLDFSYDNRMVLSLRGNTVRQNGYIDDIELVLSNWAATTVEAADSGWVIGYTTGTGLPAKMWVDVSGALPVVTKTESYENDLVVERYTYSNVVYNPALPEDTWDN